MSNVIVIGGGAAGMMAAYAAALCGHQVKLIEQNEKLGKKIFITGKGRCNITNAGDMDNLFANVMSNPKFLYSAFYTFNNEQMMSFLEEYGLKMKVERGNRVFPVSDHSSDVIATLRKALANKNVEVFLHTKVNHLLVTKEQIKGVGLSDGREVPADAVIVATPNYLHKEPVVKAAEHGVNVFCEKPIALSYQDCDDMVRACQEHGVIFMAGHVMNFFHGVRHAKKLINDGVIGKVLY